jgi:hypothetical protein
MNLSIDSEECVVSNNTYQINRVNTASRYMFWLRAKPSTRFFSKIYRGAGTQAPGLPVPTQAVLDLVPSVSGTNRNITADNYYTSFPLAIELKSRKLTSVGAMKKNKACIPPSFLANADEETFQYAFDHSNNFTLFSVAPRKNKRVVFLSTVHSEKDIVSALW